LNFIFKLYQKTNHCVTLLKASQAHPNSQKNINHESGLTLIKLRVTLEFIGVDWEVLIILDCQHHEKLISKAQKYSFG
jgi:hypothetical protein